MVSLFLLPNDCGHDGFLVGVWMSDHVHNTAHVNQFPFFFSGAGETIWRKREIQKKICFAKEENVVSHFGQKTDGGGES